MSKVTEFLKKSFKSVFDEKYKKQMKKKDALEKLIKSLVLNKKNLKKKYKHNKDKATAKEIEAVKELLNKAEKHLKLLTS